MPSLVGSEMCIRDRYQRRVHGRALAPLFLFGTENKFPVEVTANEEVEALFIPKESVLLIFQRNKRFLENYMNTSANYAKTLSDKLFFLSFKNIKQKLASYILRLSATAGDNVVMDRSQQEMADYFGVSRPSLARELSHMQEDGLISVDRKHIRILKKEKLKELIRQYFFVQARALLATKTFPYHRFYLQHQRI
eukprot:TRINITY_DN13529_c0_g1_i1.p1 TRINITY_DN13529_c0_g1~~TRINITY_DN13529_c0_g1_i1.p1  ORF type:complete len:194 (-),score=6.46 TRINITY_DN13529_c0_g1_i1:197-778(-)